MAESRLSCTMPNSEQILAMPRDKRDAHSNRSRLREIEAQDKAYRTVRDALGIPYGIEHNPEMPPITDGDDVVLIGGRRGKGKSNELGWWSSYYRIRGYDTITNMSLLNAYILDDLTDIYALGYLWHNTPVELDEMQMVSSTFEGPAHKTRMLMEFYSQLRKLMIPIRMASSQPHRIYGQIDNELTWYAKPAPAHYRPRNTPRWLPAWTHTICKYYGPHPARYPDLAEKLFDDKEDEQEANRWAHDHQSGHTAESIWRASKVSVSWETTTPGQLLTVNSDAIKSKMAERNTAVLTIDNDARTRRQYIIMQVVNMIKTGYLRPADMQWEWLHIYQQLHSFSDDRAMDHLSDTYPYVQASMEEIKQAFEVEANISTRQKTLKLQELVNRYPGYFQPRTEEENSDDPDIP